MAMIHEHWRRHWRRLHSHRLRNDLWAVHAGIVRSPREAIHRVSGVFMLRELHFFACSESSYLKAYRDDKQRTSAVCSLSTVKGIQQISRSRQYSRRRSGAPRIDQVVDTNRSRRWVGAQLYIPHLLEIVAGRPVYVRLALWFLHHPAWMEGHTGGSRLTPTVHPCPVQLGRLWVAYVVQEPNEPQ